MLSPNSLIAGPFSVTTFASVSIPKPTVAACVLSSTKSIPRPAPVLLNALKLEPNSSSIPKSVPI